MTRTNKSELNALLNTMNDLTNHPRDPYQYIDGVYTPNDGVYTIDYSYGGVRLEQMVGSGSRDISPRLSKPALAQWMRAFIAGIYTARQS